MKNQKGVSLITLIITIIVVIILAVIVLRSGASDAPDQAAFSSFTQKIGELQDAVTVAMQEAKADEILKGNTRSEAQLYNFVARGGYEAISGESGDSMWLIQSDAEAIPCTLINKKHAEKSIGIDLPVIKVETALGVEQEVSYFVTSEGTVFCWPPYVYDGKSYVNATLTVKDRKNQELDGVIATDTLYEDEVAAAWYWRVLEIDDKKITISNKGKPSADEYTYKKGDAGTTNFDGVTIWYWDGQTTTPDYRGVAASYIFDGTDLDGKNQNIANMYNNLPN